MARKSYTADEQAAAIALYVDQGPTAVREQLGIPKGTVASWANRAGLRTVCSEKTAAATEQARLRWEQRRTELADEIGAAAELALHLAVEKLADGTPSSAKDAALTMAVFVDKAQLLTGAATSRTDHTQGADIDAEVARLTAKLALNDDRAAA